nr:unnamed protein product [Callosobruchus analis]
MGVQEFYKEILLKKKKKKRIWVRDWIRRRNELGASSRLLRELAVEDPSSYMNFLRTAKTDYTCYQKKDTHLREAIPCRKKLEITLRYLATGDSFKSLMYIFRVPHNTISSFLPEVLAAIYEVLQEYIKVPKTTESWKQIQMGFESKWNFPYCCGAQTGNICLFNVQQTATYSIVLFAMVEADYCFRFIDVGSDGRSKPYKQRSLTLEQRIFNYRLSRARRVAENDFGVQASRFRIFRRPISLNVGTIQILTKVCCVLHTWMRMTSSRTYLPPGSMNEEDLITGEVCPATWRDGSTNMPPVARLYSSNNYRKDGEAVRNWYTKANAVVKVLDLDVPESVEIGSTDEIVMVCNFVASKDEAAEMKWFYNGNIEQIYQVRQVHKDKKKFFR